MATDRALPPEGQSRQPYALLDSLLEGCQIIDCQWRYLYLNEAALLHARRTSDELLGRTMMESYPGIEQTEVFGVLRRCMTERTHANLENEFLYPDGVTGWFELRVQPVPEGLFLLSLDISSRKRAERAMEQRIERLRSLRAIDLAILGTTDLRLALRTVLEETKNRLQVDAVAVFLFDSPASRLEMAASSGFRKAPPSRLRVRLGTSPTGRAALERRTIVVRELSGTSADDELASLLRQEGFQAYCAAPLVAKGQLVGVLAVAHRSPLTASAD